MNDILKNVMDHSIRHYGLVQGAVEVGYMEELFMEFSGKKNAGEIIKWLQDREHLILMWMGISPEDLDREIPVVFKVGHELREYEKDLPLSDLVLHLWEVVDFKGGKIFYSWIGGTRREWGGQVHYRVIKKQKEEWGLFRAYVEPWKTEKWLKNKLPLEF